MRFPGGSRVFAREVLPLVLHSQGSCGPEPFAWFRTVSIGAALSLCRHNRRAKIRAPPTFVNDDSLFNPGEPSMSPNEGCMRKGRLPALLGGILQNVMSPLACVDAPTFGGV